MFNTIVLMLARPIVYPSGAAFATSSVPMMPFAPPRLSTTTCAPSASAIPGATVRATISTTPPGGKPTTKRSGFAGNASAAKTLALNMLATMQQTPRSRYSDARLTSTAFFRDDMVNTVQQKGLLNDGRLG